MKETVQLKSRKKMQAGVLLLQDTVPVHIAQISVQA